MLSFKKEILRDLKEILTAILYLPLLTIIGSVVIGFNPFELDDKQLDDLILPTAVAFISYVIILVTRAEKKYKEDKNIDSTSNIFSLLLLQILTGIWAVVISVIVFYPITLIVIGGILIFFAILEHIEIVVAIAASIAVPLISLVAFIALIKFIWKIV